MPSTKPKSHKFYCLPKKEHVVVPIKNVRLDVVQAKGRDVYMLKSVHPEYGYKLSSIISKDYAQKYFM